MIGSQLWERHLFKEIIKTFVLFLLSLYFLYILVDYSAHLQDMLNTRKVLLKQLCIYYAAIFSKRCDLFLPLILLLTTLTLLCSLNRKNELLILQAGGISLYSLMRPFFIVAIVCAVLNYLNSEWVLSLAHTFIERFETHNFHMKKRQRKQVEAVHMLPLEDNTYLIYQKYHPHVEELFDVYWMQTSRQIWHIDTLSLKNDPPQGFNVDRFFRSDTGLLEKGLSYDKYSFDCLKIRPHRKNSIAMEHAIESQSIGTLIKWQNSYQCAWKDKRNEILTRLYFKMVMPWLALLIVLGVFPYATRFSRNTPVFFLFASGIFGYIAVLTIMETTVILGENHVLPPLWAVCTVPLLLALFFGNNILKLRLCR